ncbi:MULTISPECIES: glycerophosphodiester phosphodiesterase family protein [unclassified Salinivibrio]|uniref:glycerophosphodiester phosphodiesterase family protein n=1 Tax=unclassified Salinivibrio TaxID=2636825 RepID=UPI00128BAAA2|nr:MULTISPECIES: glycerophosphodiester phosphodiesterase family protein [unclassified Salinivibrio]MPS31683.1 glycerophosphoryl diester phosphodiesterase [Salinivibrio sp. VYel7]MPX90254.1 glycerophosphoryl diester phosphodiesterase [Salinivibrio sp. VYel1]MPX93078.1 glycerophosphoryl diester phosphodiesterase [Salinivibrio sp. VYel9]MPX95238.1 glycerophosphoryl diester phosphodiesterase [Salinivibrio sp. VYel6]MPX99296.1 glycerophosphoryl diester phosphodiesterase [Salinivibrio sp. VYel4]
MKIAPQQLCGHRGVAAHAPENTLTSIAKVREMGLSWVEVDVQLTQDGVPVVFHDHSLQRCTNGVGALKDTALADLQQLDAGGHFSPMFGYERVPTLMAVLAQAHRDALYINLEIKTYPDSDIPALCRAIFACLSASPISTEKVLVSSFSLEALAIVRDEMPESARAILWETIPDNWREFRDLATFSIHCNYRHLTQEKAKAVKDSGLALKCYTPNKPVEVEALWGWGVDMMITDDPSKYLAHPY